MISNINFSNTKQYLIDSFVTIQNESAKLAGYTVTVVKSGLNTAKESIKDPLIAAVSVVAVNILTILIIRKVSDEIIEKSKLFNNEDHRLFLTATVGMSIYFGTIIAYTKLAALPLTANAIVGISLATLLCGALIDNAYGR